jgi:glycosyltransferase involved in cell wall biosynthesis
MCLSEISAAADYHLLPSPVPVTLHQWPETVSPLVSVVCMTYNHEPFIREAIMGFLMQRTTFKIEILIHDDASIDKTADIVKEFEHKFPMLIKPTYQVENQYKKNPKTAKYVQPCERKGKYIAFCEGDDYWTDPLKLQKQVEFLEANPGYSFSYCRFETLNEETGEVQPDNNGKLFEKGEALVEFDFERFYKGWHMGSQTLVYRKSMWDPAYARKYKYAKDIHLIVHLLLQGKGVCLGFSGAVYRKHKGGVYSGASDIDNAKLSYLCYREIYQKNRQEYFLKLKYIRFAKFYIDHLVKVDKYAKAFLVASILMLQTRQINYYNTIAAHFARHNKNRAKARLRNAFVRLRTAFRGR